MGYVHVSLNTATELRILVVDDDEQILEMLVAFLRRKYDVAVATDGIRALELLKEQHFDIVLSDVDMPRMNGIELLKAVRRLYPEVAVVIMTGLPEVEAAVQALKVGAIDYLSKPFDLQVLGDAITRISGQTDAGGKLAAVVAPHRKIDDYEIVDVLGEGTTGLVLLAQRGGKQVAIKVLKLGDIEESRREHTLRRFMSEAAAIRLLRHQNVVSYIDHGLAREERIPYMVTEFVDGVTLKKLMAEGALDYRSKAEIVRQIALALGAIHAHSICHRDVKPSNVLIDGANKAVLTDFGIAHLPNSDVTMTQNILGTPSYMAPEAFLSSRTDHRADLFSLGVLSYELFLGRKPFIANNFVVLGTKVNTETPPEPRVLDPDLPEELQLIIGNLMRKSPDERYGAAAHVVRDLDAYLAG
jgi:DNA-binding response OmpR family regulator